MPYSSHTTIGYFRGEFRFLSNFWNDYHVPIILGDYNFPTVEHAYQAAKTDNIAARIQILNCSTPGQAKRLARTIQPIRRDWYGVRFDTMKGLVRQKFTHPIMSPLLIETYPAFLIEGNTWGDIYWGCVHNGTNWKGFNALGKILMIVRAELMGIEVGYLNIPQANRILGGER